MKLIKSLRYLPIFMRDFHDQKDLFKSVFDWGYGKETEKPSIGWIDAHIFVIDVFLQYMALHGYVLKKSNTKEPTCDIYTTIKTHRDKRSEAFKNMLLDNAKQEPKNGNNN